MLQCKIISLDDDRNGFHIANCALHNSSLPLTRNPAMSDARPSFFDFDMTKIFADFHFRPFDVEAVWAAQRRNIEAFSLANQLAVEAVHAVAKRQMEMTQQSFEDLSGLMRDMTQPVSTEARIAKQTEYAKKIIDKGLTHGREIATM